MIERRHSQQRSKMFNFPLTRNSWRLDIVSILAVLGESNIKIHAQSITASKFCLLPRLLPAPQALLRETRPKRLPFETDVEVYGVRSGAQRSGLNYIPNLIHRVSEIPAYQVVDVEITRGRRDSKVTSRTWAPLNQLALGSCLLSIGLLIWSVLLGDGVAFIAILVMSFASSALGCSSRWKTANYKGRSVRRFPAEKVVLKTRWGAFLVVQCDGDVARELYWTPEECIYNMGNVASRAFGGVIGGLGVMVAVVLFGNCSWVMQAAIGSSYAFLNVSYWLVTVIPETYSWDLSTYSVTVNHGNSGFGSNGSFTSALWQSIALTRSVRWVRSNNVTPNSSPWKAWLDEAEQNIENDKWDPEQALTEHLDQVV